MAINSNNINIHLLCQMQEEKKMEQEIIVFSPSFSLSYNHPRKAIRGEDQKRKEKKRKRKGKEGKALQSSCEGIRKCMMKAAFLSIVAVVQLTPPRDETVGSQVLSGDLRSTSEKIAAARSGVSPFSARLATASRRNDIR